MSSEEEIPAELVVQGQGMFTKYRRNTGNENKFPKCNGVYRREQELRNGKYCYTKYIEDEALQQDEKDKSSITGAIYFDGQWWKLCQSKNGRIETGWNFSQLPSDKNSLEPPLGNWSKEKSLSHTGNEQGIVYDALTVEYYESGASVKPAKKGA